MSDHFTPGKPVRPGCEIADSMCGSECHCYMGSYCATHQDEGDEWPCEPQKEYESSTSFKAQHAVEMAEVTAENYRTLRDAHNKLCEDHKRLRRLITEAVMPFMRDIMPDWGAHLTIGINVGDEPSLLGMDDGFQRGGRQAHGITYKEASGRVWKDGKPEAVPVAKLHGRRADAQDRRERLARKHGVVIDADNLVLRARNYREDGI